MTYEHEALTKCDEIYKLVIENTSDYVSLIDEKGVYIYVSPSHQAMGYDPADLIGRSGVDFVHPDDRAKVVSVLTTYVAKLAKAKLEEIIGIKKDISRMCIDFRFRDIKGDWHYIETTPDIVKNPFAHGYAGLLISKDVTSRRKEEEALRKSEEKFRILSQEFHALLDAIPDNLTLQSPDLKIQWANEGAAMSVGKSISDLIGGYCYKIWNDRSDPCDPCPVEKSFLIGKQSRAQVSTPDGRIWELRAVPIFGEDGKVSKVVEVGRNITDIKNSEKIRLENVRLSLASKAKSDFLANMSHELRTPLNSIIGFTELIKQKNAGEVNEKQMHYLENVLTSGNHLLRLINDILDISGVESGNIELALERISVAEIIDESIILIKEGASARNIALKKDLHPALEFIEADRLRLKQILFNLINNAVKFSKKGSGTVTISTRKDGDMAKFSVTDTGIGIREGDMGRLFKEFEQLDMGISRNYGGTGLGLAISKNLVELHGGKIMVDSRYGEGSTFSFLIPISSK
ncbi:MAG: PAS domain S-box protein [Euryarchaeota archaeon]|nr:PAS domain S-box protein [Euryarchaeota archaeon]